MQSPLREAGRGHPLLNSNAPERLVTDPIVTPSRVELENTCAKISEDVHTIGNGSGTNLSSGWSTIAGDYANVLREGRAQFDKIVAQCRSQKKKFFDASFYYDKKETVFGPTEGRVPSGRLVDSPQQIIRMLDSAGNGFKPYLPQEFNGDYLKSISESGSLLAPPHFGAKYLSDALKVLSQHWAALATSISSSPLHRVFFGGDSEAGAFGVVLHHPVHGWTYVIIDDLIAVAPTDKSVALYGPECSKASWPIVLFKAMAKMYGSFGHLEARGGRVGEVLADLFGGGVSNELSLLRPELNGGGGGFLNHQESSIAVIDAHDDSNADDSAVMLSADLSYIARSAADPLMIVIGEIGSSINLTNSIVGAFGLERGISYVVKAVETTFDGRNFLRVRNMSDEAQDGVGAWTGPYSSGAADWVRNPLHAKQLKPERLPSHEFWITAEDFSTYLGAVTTVRFAEPTTKTISSVRGINLPDTASSEGGVTYFPLAELEVTSTQSVDVTLSVSQDSLGLSDKEYLSIGLVCDGPRTDSGNQRQQTSGKVLTASTRTIAPSLSITEPGRYFVRLVVEGLKPSPVETKIRFSVLAPQDSNIAVTLTDGDVLKASEQMASGGAAKALKSMQHADPHAGPPLSAGTIPQSEIQSLIDAAFELSDPWKIGRIDRKMAEQGFMNVLRATEAARSFSEAVGKSATQQLDHDAFARLVLQALRSPK